MRPKNKNFIIYLFKIPELQVTAVTSSLSENCLATTTKGFIESILGLSYGIQGRVPCVGTKKQL